MRAVLLASLASLALSLSGAIAAAESPAPAQQDKPKIGSGRVNTLSPDEARRAARARERAARAAKPAAGEPREASKPAPAASAAAHTATAPAPSRETAAETARPSRHQASARAHVRHAHRASGRRELAGDRYPQVGDVVPPGVRLRGYPAEDDDDTDMEPRRAYAPRGAYLPRPAPGAPPYPGLYGED